MKKLLLCIGISILITSFIGSTFLFVSSMVEFLPFRLNLYESVETLEETVKEFKESSNSTSKDACAFGYLILRGPLQTMKVYLVSLITGIMLGSLIYIFVIKKIKGKQLIIYFILLFAIFSFLIYICDTITIQYGYSFIELFIGYMVLFLVAYLGCILHQKWIINKLNKELNK